MLRRSDQFDFELQQPTTYTNVKYYATCNEKKPKSNKGRFFSRNLTLLIHMKDTETVNWKHQWK